MSKKAKKKAATKKSKVVTSKPAAEQQASAEATPAVNVGTEGHVDHGSGGTETQANGVQVDAGAQSNTIPESDNQESEAGSASSRAPTEETPAVTEKPIKEVGEVGNEINRRDPATLRPTKSDKPSTFNPKPAAIIHPDHPDLSAAQLAEGGGATAKDPDPVQDELERLEKENPEDEIDVVIDSDTKEINLDQPASTVNVGMEVKASEFEESDSEIEAGLDDLADISDMVMSVIDWVKTLQVGMCSLIVLDDLDNLAGIPACMHLFIPAAKGGKLGAIIQLHSQGDMDPGTAARSRKVPTPEAQAMGKKGYWVGVAHGFDDAQSVVTKYMQFEDTGLSGIM